MRKRLAIIDREKCHPTECGNYLCIKLCPVNRTGADCIFKGDDNKARIDELLCTGCSICSTRCPYGAITIINLPETLNKPPIHRYGENMFELYSLPTPIFGKVSGIVGKNGLGKSTAFKILSGLLVPNLGNLTEQSSFQNLINYFKGTETQKFLEEVKKQNIKLSYKPQMVELIPKTFQGTVRELLEKINKDKLKEISDKLKLNNFLDTNITKISGGELQRVAIAATVLKKANLYLFDEPTSYLDIKQRIQMSKFIHSLPNQNTAAMVIEHDLIILDYMAESVNIMYGNEGSFGIVSGIKPTREGINVFLDGFLKEENIRFRDNPVKFDKARDKKRLIENELLSWNKLSKKLGNFALTAESGTLNKGEIVGILGENGIGKTSFVKLLAGVIESKQISTNIKVSYKEQYLQTESDLTVAEFLQDAIERYNHQLIKPFDLEKLFSQKLSELSGGQLQRVAIAHCLSKDAELFLLDEPSAYLDVDQRLLLAKVLRNLAEERDISILVVDHDLMFIDQIADRLLVFSGVPAKEGLLKGPFSMEEGMNKFLESLNITLRRDLTSRRPRINKENSVKDREQRQANKWYYS